MRLAAGCRSAHREVASCRTLSRMAEDTSRTLYLIDGHAQFFRAYHAIRTRMTSPVTKEPTNMTYGFVGMLLKVLRDYQPDHLAVVIDKSGDRESFRSEIYPEYKANRDEPPEDLRPQIERCLEVLEMMKVPVLGEEGVEADDVIASLVRKLQREEPDLRIRIVSKDKDLTQLVNDRTELFDVHTDKTVGPSDIFKTEGVTPEMVRDILALMGDSVDNIPGVPGIGPKTAAQLIKQYGSIDNLLNHLDEIKGKRRENLEASKELLDLSRQLVALREDMDVELDLEAARADPKKLDAGALLDAFRQLGFNRYPDELRKIMGEAAVDHAALAGDRAGGGRGSGGGNGFADSLFAPAATVLEVPIVKAEAGAYRAITSKKELAQLVKEIRAAGRFAIDTETDSLTPIEAKLCGVAISIEPGTGVYIPVRSPEPKSHLDERAVLDALRPLLEDPRLTKIGHNLKYDMNVLRRHELQLAGFAEGRIFDTMVASYLIDASRSSHKLDVLALALLNHVCTPISDLIGKGKAQRTFDTVPLEQAMPYATEDADIALRLYEAMKPELESMGLRSLFDELEMPLVEVLAELEWNGITVDADELDRQREKLMKRIDALRDEISDAGSIPFNPDSPRQLAAVLFNKPDQEPPGLGIKPLKRGKTGPSTDVEVLEKLAADPAVESELPRLIVEYRQLTKLVNTYLIALKDAINPRTGRVHASFHQTVAATGRLSSSDPNLQNIPIRTEIGREIRRAFIAPEGRVLLTADYSQIELRLLAHLSEDEGLIEAFRNDADIHRAVAAEVFGVEPEQVTSEQRSSAKMVNFGIVYGITAYGLARRLGGGTTNEQAKQIIEDYKAKYPRIERFLEQCIEHAKTHGYVETMMKRRRAIPQIEARNPMQRQLGERMAINTVVQGSAADLIKLAMVDLHRTMPAKFPAVRQLLQIHDELVFEVPEDQQEPAMRFVVERMEAAMELKIPLKVEAACSRNWIDAK
ncbi:MAG: DNA polymerase I [Phycisphaerales bacterium]|nr:MAG: DNA polymerase I [Phycisphaerales bacterium]